MSPFGTWGREGRADPPRRGRRCVAARAAAKGYVDGARITTRPRYNQGLAAVKRLEVVATVGMGIGAACASGWSETDLRRYDWVAARYEPVLEAQLPLECDAEQSCRLNHDFWVGDREFALTLRRNTSGDPSLRVRTPIGKSVWDQLWRLYRTDRNASLPSVVSQTRVLTEDFDLPECPELAREIRSTDEEALLSAEPNDVITIHPWVRTCCAPGGGRVVVTYDEHPLAEWLSRVQAAVASCRAAANQAAAADRGLG